MFNIEHNIQKLTYNSELVFMENDPAIMLKS